MSNDLIEDMLRNKFLSLIFLSKHFFFKSKSLKRCKKNEWFKVSKVGAHFCREFKHPALSTIILSTTYYTLLSLILSATHTLHSSIPSSSPIFYTSIHRLIPLNLQIQIFFVWSHPFSHSRLRSIRHPLSMYSHLSSNHLFICHPCSLLIP